MRDRELSDVVAGVHEQLQVPPGAGHGRRRQRRTVASFGVWFMLDLPLAHR
jgi:hypothetical protein